MADSVYDQWQKELKVLLDKIEHHPSADLTEERERAAVLSTLIAKRSDQANTSEGATDA